MKRSLMLPMLSVAALVLMAYHLVQSSQAPPDRPPYGQPALPPFGEGVAAAGVVEARTENIAVGAHVPGVVVDVLVSEGQRVEKDQALFRLDSRHVRAELAVRQAQLNAAKASLDRLERLPRPEEIPPSEARVRKAKADLAGQIDMLARRERLVATKAVSEEELVQQREAVAAAKANLAQAEAEDQLLKAGTWDYELATARAEVLRNESLVQQQETELDRLEIRAPVAGSILRLDVRPGEYVGTPPDQPLVILGDLSRMRVRVDIDEQDIPRYRPGMPGVAYLRGDTRQPLPLEFVQVVPYVRPKSALTGQAAERVDTRVLQVRYALDPGVSGVFVGQQVDVFLAADASVAARAKHSSTGADENGRATEKFVRAKLP